MSRPAFTRRVDGNECLKIGKELRDLMNVEEGDYVEFEVINVYEVEDE
jgi:bifunctional DNA-binding transcriptional regulator/antitoxin component of YhaV-PrlF toxin-antitoxin module